MEEEVRPSLNEYFFQLAINVARRSTCIRNPCGAVIVRDKQILSTGYCGAAAGLSHCTDKGACLRAERGAKPGEHYEWCVSVHAEANAIIQAAKHGISIKGASLYCTEQPCDMCSRMIVNAGIKAVFFIKSGRYEMPEAEKTLSDAGVRVFYIHKEDLK